VRDVLVGRKRIVAKNIRRKGYIVKSVPKYKA
jgi:hypothetical protein